MRSARVSTSAGGVTSSLAAVEAFAQPGRSRGYFALIGADEVRPGGAEIVPAGPEGDGAGQPRGSMSVMRPRPGTRRLDEDNGQGDELDGGFPLGQLADGEDHGGVAEEFAQARDEEFAEEDGA